jgi:hypothetical protein
MVKANNTRPVLAKERKDDISRLAEAVLAEARVDERDLPVRPGQLALGEGLTISFGHYAEAFDGLLEHRTGRFHIYCNLDRVECEDSPRSRFTLAHELGHYFIDEHRQALAAGLAPSHPSRCEYESELLVEQEADHFAACLLMPQHLFIRRARGKAQGIPAIQQLAASFGTSLTSTAIRYAVLGVSHCVIIKWSREGYAWKWLSHEAFASGFRKTIESKSCVVPGSATAAALAGNQLPTCGYFRSATTAPFWFPFVRHGSWKDVILLEQAIPLGRFGALTILFPESGSFPPIRD